MQKLIRNLLGFTVMFALSMTACTSDSSISSLLFSLDKDPPSVSNVQPSGLIKSTSTTASVSYSDTGTGIDSASAFVYLDNVAIAGCTKTATSINCLTVGLAEGAHSLTVGVMDVAGNFSKSAGQFTVDSMAPAVSGFTPSGIIESSPTLVTVSYSESGSGVSPASVVVSIDGKVLQGCSPTTTSVNCPVNGIGPGDHTIRVSVADSAGFTGTGSGIFTITPPAPPPSSSPPPGNCDPNYSGCVPRASDVDCAGGSGNGPAYVAGPVSVIGSDIYGLDRDGDGVGCE